MQTPREIANQLSAICRSGFRNEHHWAAWFRKHRDEIYSLPVTLRLQVLRAYEDASAKEFSK